MRGWHAPRDPMWQLARSMPAPIVLALGLVRTGAVQGNHVSETVPPSLPRCGFATLAAHGGEPGEWQPPSTLVADLERALQRAG